MTEGQKKSGVALSVLPAEDDALVLAMKARLRGDVRFSPHDRALYSTDASIYQVDPIGVICPRDADDLQQAVEVCAAHGVAMLPRGGGTSLAGQCTNRSVVLDLSQYLCKLIEVDAIHRNAVAQSGVSLDQLNRLIATKLTTENGPRLFFAPDPATSAQCALGGAIGNNAAGARSIVYGRTSENILGLDVILASGQQIWLEPHAGRKNAIARQLAAAVAEVVQRHAELIRTRFPKTVRRNAGYGLDLILQQLDRGIAAEDLDLSGLICGSEGTLAVVAGAKVKLHPMPLARGLAIVSFGSLEAAIDAVVPILGTNPSAVELLDEVVLNCAANNNECRKYLDLLAPIDGKLPAAALYVEYQAIGSRDEIAAGFDRLRQAVPAGAINICPDQPAMLRAWALRKAGEPLLHAMPGRRKPATFVEDNAIPVENLARFVREFKQIVTDHGTSAAYWAHASVGVLHVRPMIDLHDPADRENLRSIAVQVADLARDCGGVMSGEHGDGRVRGPLLERFFGTELMGAFRQIKTIFDPKNLLNPGNIVAPGPVESITQNLRIDRPRAGALAGIQTAFDYSNQHDFREALEMCNGAGVCRKTSGGTMCPSYRATRDERHATRGRANALRNTILSGVKSPDFSDADTLATLDLCLSCKACKSECPSNVDVAKLKAEYSHQHHKATGHVPLSARVFGHIRLVNQMGSLIPAMANSIASLKSVRKLMNRLLGLSANRSMPAFAPSLYRWFVRHKSGRSASSASPATPLSQSHVSTLAPSASLANHTSSQARPLPGAAAAHPKRVVLFGDCFVTYNEPEIGQAAIKLLESLGYEVLLPKVGCCGRSLISNGLLDDAIATANRTFSQLKFILDDPDIVALVVAEPSCLSAIKDDWLSLKLSAPLASRKALADKSMLIEQFVESAWGSHPRQPNLEMARQRLTRRCSGDQSHGSHGGEGIAGKKDVSTASHNADSGDGQVVAPTLHPQAKPQDSQHAGPNVNSCEGSGDAGPHVILHGHCHQKSLWGDETSAAIIRRIVGDKLTVLPTGCCGMAGAFGYAEHRYDLSMAIGEETLFPAMRNAPADAVLIAPGTSCRHQVHDGTGRKAMHPAQWLWQVLGDDPKDSDENQSSS